MASKVTLTYDLGRVSVVSRDYLPSRKDQSSLLSSFVLSEPTERLSFYYRTGKNVLLSTDGRIAERKDPCRETGFGGVVTSRPMEYEESFTIELTKMVNFWGGFSLGIGVTTRPANQVEFPPWMAFSRPDNWMMYFFEGWPGKFSFYFNGIEMCKECGTGRLQPKVGDRLCVVRMKNGDLLFIINGRILYKALLNSKEEFYGVADIRGNVQGIKIVESQ